MTLLSVLQLCTLHRVLRCNCYVHTRPFSGYHTAKNYNGITLSFVLQVGLQGKVVRTQMQDVGKKVFNEIKTKLTKPKALLMRQDIHKHESKHYENTNKT